MTIVEPISVAMPLHTSVRVRRLAPAHSFSANPPADLRRVIDLEFAQGINRPVIHTSVHQPVDDKVPGLSLSFFGQYFTRHETWAGMAKPWIDYIARNSFMLQQGRNVADVAYFYGEEAPLTSLYRDNVTADVPVQYAYDFINADVVLNRLSVDGGELEGKWDVSFQEGRGAPPSIRLEHLQSLSTHSDAGVRYFSGISRYVKTFDVPQDAKPSAPLMLDLGAVGDVAAVRVNGKLLGTLWKAPYRVDIGDAVRRGRNELDIRVANLWVNRLIGDARPGATRVTFTTVPTYQPDAPLRPSGLIGPVTLSR